MDRSDDLAELARKYLDLWTEHWAASLISSETAAMMAKLASMAGGVPDGWPDWRNFVDPGKKPETFRTAHGSGDGRVDELERRVAQLERRLAEFAAEAGPGMAQNAGRARGRSRKG